MDAVKNQPCHNFTYKTYQRLGAFITSMCGVSQQKKDYWAFYVNTIYSQVGVSNYVVGQHDNLLMVYETSTH